MASTQILSNTKISAEGKQHFPETAQDGRYEPKIKFSNPNLIRARVVDGTVIVPASWRDDDEDDEMQPKEFVN